MTQGKSSRGRVPAAGLALLVAVATIPASASAPLDWNTLPTVVDGPGGEAWLTRHPGGRPSSQAADGVQHRTTESTLCVTPDEGLIVFHRAEDPAGRGKDDLFAARRSGSGWGPAIHLGNGANSPEFEYGREVSRDARTLYFTTHRGGRAGIMAVDLARAMSR